MRTLEPVNGDNKTFTYQARIKETDLLDEFLCAYAELYCRIERQLFADFCRGKNLEKLKNEYLIRYGITARQFNAIRIILQGKIASVQALQCDYIKDVKTRLKKVTADIKSLASKQHLTERQRNKLHQKRRLFCKLKLKLQRLENDKKNGRVRICFGSKRVFKQQFNLQANKFDSHEQWQKSWRLARSSQFFIIGSKDETMGNQSCIATINEADNTINLKLRVPDCLQYKYGRYVTISNIEFQYGQAEIIAALNSNITRNIYSRKAQVAITKDLYKQYGKAINYRLLKDDKGWRVFVTCDKSQNKLISDKQLGAIGIDINIGHLAVTEVDRHGNYVSSFKINICTYGKSHHQAQAIIGDAVKQVVAFAASKCKPLVVEQLDFRKKRQDLAYSKNKHRNRQLSSFAYTTIINTIKSKAFKHGIAVYQVNPAYSSVIGRVKFASIYKISVHQAAAMVIARRIYGFSESLPSHLDNIPDDTGGRFTLEGLVKIPHRHVWHAWAKVRKKLQTALAERFQQFIQFGNNSLDLTGELAF